VGKGKGGERVVCEGEVSEVSREDWLNGEAVRAERKRLEFFTVMLEVSRESVHSPIL
jgi:hypothetical protein